MDIFYLVRTYKAPKRKLCYTIEINRMNECKEFGRIIRRFLKSTHKQQKIIELEFEVGKGRKDKRKTNRRKKQNSQNNQLILLNMERK